MLGGDGDGANAGTDGAGNACRLESCGAMGGNADGLEYFDGGDGRNESSSRLVPFTKSCSFSGEDSFGKLVKLVKLDNSL